jgi:hypothetical protein
MNISRILPSGWSRPAIAAVVTGILVVTGAAAGAETVSRTYALKGFDRIHVSGVYEVRIVVGEDFAVEISGHERELDRAEVYVENGTLMLGQRRSEWHLWRRQGVRAVVSAPMLAGIKVSGVAEGVVSGIAADKFSAELSGVGDLRLSGTCNVLWARVSGIGDLDAAKFRCGSVDVRLSGIGAASVHAGSEVDAIVSGIGDITVHGSPAEVRKRSGLLSSVSVR